MIPSGNFEPMVVKGSADFAIRVSGCGADVVGHNWRYGHDAYDAPQRNMLPSPAPRKADLSTFYRFQQLRSTAAEAIFHFLGSPEQTTASRLRQIPDRPRNHAETQPTIASGASHWH